MLYIYIAIVGPVYEYHVSLLVRVKYVMFLSRGLLIGYSSSVLAKISKNSQSVQESNQNSIFSIFVYFSCISSINLFI